MTDHKDLITARETAYQQYINEETPNGNPRMDNIVLCAGADPDRQRHIATQVDLAFQAGWAAAIARANIPPTLSAALEVPEVAALVEAAKRYATGYMQDEAAEPELCVHGQHQAAKAVFAALAALDAAKP